MGLRITGLDLTLHPNATRDFIEDPAGPVFADLDRRMTRAQGGAQRMVRVRTGRLLSTIRKRRGVSRRGPHVDLVAGGRLARYVMHEHDGTVPHIIRPRRRRALRFIAGGQVVFTRRVRHPGTRGSYFLTRALPLAGG